MVYVLIIKDFVLTVSKSQDIRNIYEISPFTQVKEVFHHTHPCECPLCLMPLRIRTALTLCTLRHQFRQVHRKGFLISVNFTKFVISNNFVIEHNFKICFVVYTYYYKGSVGVSASNCVTIVYNSVHHLIHFGQGLPPPSLLHQVFCHHF